MGAEFARPRRGIEMVRLPMKSKPITAQASDGDIDDLTSLNPQQKSSGVVLPYVGVACLGAILFGYHLGYVLAYSG